MAIILTTSDLLPYLSNLWLVLDKVCQRQANHTEQAKHASTATSGSPTAPSHSTLKVALLNHFDSLESSDQGVGIVMAQCYAVTPIYT